MPIPNTNSDDLIKLLKPCMKILVTIEFGPEDSYSFSTTIVGCKRERYVLIDMPVKAREDLVMRKIVNIQIILRGICDTELGHILAFKTSIIRSISKPFGLLFIKFPKHFVTKPIREHERYKLSLPAVMHEGKHQFKGKLIDFSISGCALFIPGLHHLEKDMFIEIKSTLSPLLPQDLACQIVSVRQQGKGMLVGVKFLESIAMTAALKKEILERAFMAGSV
ncbi:PilZ domain-containing protein [Vibrio anguillarum]|uniref:PilZ domain-containing protein n=1 Tax=Vibrio anguillarum TaxID=55601 RepID=UPI0004748E16|nr:flagellar brake protein [Vibrio anguillarum]OEE38700.1 pilus assembly protein PilZ [Vibrio anguillarum]